MFALASPTKGHGCRKAGLHRCFSPFSPKSMGTDSPGHSMLHMLSITANPVRVCFVVSLHLTFRLQCTSTSESRKRSSWQDLWWKEGGPFPGYWGAGELLWGSQAMQHVLKLSPSWLPPASLPSLHRAGTIRCWHVTHGAAGQGIKYAQCNKSQPYSQVEDRQKNKGKKGRMLRP